MIDREVIDSAKDLAEQNTANFKLQILEKAGISFEKIIKEFKATGFANMKDYFDVADGGELSFKPFDKLSRNKASAIKKIREKSIITESKEGEKIYKTSTVEIELWDKHAALWRLIELRGDKPAEKNEVIYPDQIQYSPEERRVLKEVAMAQAKEDLKRLRGE